MDFLLATIVFILGAIIGSFLNVVIYRLHTGKSLQGRSHCMSCGAKLSALELVPLVSYVALRARCGHCGAHIPPRYFIVELLTAFSFLWLWQLFSANIPLLLFNLVLISALIVIIFYDMRHTIIPDEMVVIITILAGVYIAWSFFATRDFTILSGSIIGAVGASLFFGGLWYLSKGRWMGLGDAKLAFPLGMLAGFPGAYSMVVFGFVLGALVSVCILLLQKLFKKGKTRLRFGGTELTMKSEVPFAPFLVAGYVLAGILNADIFRITFSILF